MKLKWEKIWKMFVFLFVSTYSSTECPPKWRGESIFSCLFGLVVSGTAGLGHLRYMPRMITIRATLLVRNRKKNNLILYFFLKKRVLCSIGILRESIGKENCWNVVLRFWRDSKARDLRGGDSWSDQPYYTVYQVSIAND